MKFLTLIFTFLISNAVLAGSCGTTSCYDYCTSSYITVQGNTCESTYDYNRSCYTAYGSCSR